VPDAAEMRMDPRALAEGRQKADALPDGHLVELVEALKKESEAATRDLRARFVHRNATPVKFRVVELVDRRLRAVVRFHLHEAKTAGPAGRHVAHHANRGNGAGLRKQILERPLLRVEGQIPDEQLPIHTPSTSLYQQT